MPLKFIGVDSEGRRRHVRQRYDPRWYTVPAGWIEELCAGYKGYVARELLDEYGGPFFGWTKVRELERGGKAFIVLSRNADDQWAIEIELTDGKIGEIRALPPEEAWGIAREFDARRTPPLDVES